MRNGAEFNIAAEVVNITGADALKDDGSDAAAVEAAADGIVDTCAISCRNYQMLTSGQFSVQCYRRCVPMDVSTCMYIGVCV